MDYLHIPNENDFRKWIKEALLEILADGKIKLVRPPGVADNTPMNRKEVAGLFRISLVTLHDWMNRGLPHH